MVTSIPVAIKLRLIRSARMAQTYDSDNQNSIQTYLRDLLTYYYPLLGDDIGIE